MDRLSVRLALIALLTLSSLQCNRQFTEAEPAQKSGPVRLNQTFSINQDQEVALEKTSLRIRFLFVTDDSRCPSDAECVIAGSAHVLLRVTGENNLTSQLVLEIPGEVSMPYEQNEFVNHRGFQFKLLSLSPYPVFGREVREQDYRILLLVT